MGKNNMHKEKKIKTLTMQIKSLYYRTFNGIITIDRSKPVIMK